MKELTWSDVYAPFTASGRETAHWCQTDRTGVPRTPGPGPPGPERASSVLRPILLPSISPVITSTAMRAGRLRVTRIRVMFTQAAT